MDDLMQEPTCDGCGGTIAQHTNLLHCKPQQEQPSFAEWTHDYVRDNLHKLEQPQQEPAVAQHRFRHPQKGTPDWSVWQPCSVKKRPAWEIDSQGYEVEYRALYTADQMREYAKEAVEAERARPRTGLPMVIAGAIFDFAGFLTTRKQVIKVGSTANAAPVADLVKEWAELRGLSLDDAAVLSWQETLPLD